MMHMVVGVVGALRILLHYMRCPVAQPTATVVHTDAGRIFECGCGFGVWEAYR